MSIRRVAGFGSAILISGAVLVFPLAGISGAPTGHPWKSNVPFTETVIDPATVESVMVTGIEALTLHVTGNVVTGWNTSLKATLHKTVGLGETSGNKYKAKGTTTLTATYHAGPPTSPKTYQASFALYPPGPPCKLNHPPGPCVNPTAILVPATITLSADGSVASVQVGHTG
jgi:hypothetical protein